MKAFFSVSFAIIFAFILVVPGVARADAATDEELLQDLCGQMEAAYESRNADAVAGLYDNLGARGSKLLKRLFKTSNSVTVKLEVKNVDPTGTEAVVSLTYVRILHKWCNRKLESHPQHEYVVRKIDGEWKFIVG